MTLFPLLFVIPASHISFKTMKYRDLYWVRADFKFRQNCQEYHFLCLNLEKPRLLKWLQLLCFFQLPVSLEEKSLALVLILSFPVAKGAWYQLSLSISFPAWQHFIFHGWQKIWAISLRGYDLQENRSSRSAPNSKSSVTNIFSYNCRWYELASYTLDKQCT